MPSTPRSSPSPGRRQPDHRLLLHRLRGDGGLAGVLVVLRRAHQAALGEQARVRSWRRTGASHRKQTAPWQDRWGVGLAGQHPGREQRISVATGDVLALVRPSLACSAAPPHCRAPSGASSTHGRVPSAGAGAPGPHRGPACLTPARGGPPATPRSISSVGQASLHADANLEGERGGHKDPLGVSGALESVEGNVHKNARIWGP